MPELDGVAKPAAANEHLAVVSTCARVALSRPR
jgi:hypothetical protein